MLPILTGVSPTGTHLTGYIGEPNWSDDGIRISFILTDTGKLAVFLHAHGTTLNVEVLGHA